MATIMIELPRGEGIVRRDDGEIALTHDVALGGGQPLQPYDTYQPISVGLTERRMLFGGLLPPGVGSVEAVEATGVRKAVLRRFPPPASAAPGDGCRFSRGHGVGGRLGLGLSPA